MGHPLWLPAVAIHRLGVVGIAPSPQHCFRTAHPCAQSVNSSPKEPVLYRSSRQSSATSSPILTEDGTSVRLSFQSCSLLLLLLANESSGVTVRMKLFRDFNLLAAGWWWNSWCLASVVWRVRSMRQSSWCVEERYRPVGVHCPSSLV